MQLMRTSLYIFVIMALTLSAPNANAQSRSIYGLEDEVKITQPQTQPINAKPITLQESIAAFREFQAAFLNEDLEYMLSILSEPEKSKAVAQINSNGALYYINSNKPIVTWKIRCVACWDDEVHGRQCAIQDRRFPPSKHNNKFYSNQHLFKKENGLVTLAERTSSNVKRGRRLEKMQKNNNRVCNLDKYDLQLGTPNKNEANKDDAVKNLLLGVTGVLDALGN